MIELEIISTNGEHTTLNVESILAIDGVQYQVSSQPTDAGLERRIQNLEQSVVLLLGAAKLLPQYQQASSCVESQPPSVPVEQVQSQSSSVESPG